MQPSIIIETHLAFPLFGVAGIMMRIVPKFCSLVIEGIHLILADECPHWKYDDKVRVPSNGASVIRSFSLRRLHCLLHLSSF